MINDGLYYYERDLLNDEADQDENDASWVSKNIKLFYGNSGSVLGSFEEYFST